MKATRFFVLFVCVLATLGIGTLCAQTGISVDGVVRSTSGGFEFPDGSVQTTAAACTVALLPDTGQTGCWGAKGARACAETGEDGEYQAGISWPTPRFSDNGDGTVTDELTELVWLKDAACAGTTATGWQSALDWIDSFNTTAIACTDYAANTFTDWRLANVRELASLVDFGQVDPALPSGHPFIAVQTANAYWSSTSSLTDTGDAWLVALVSGETAATDKASLAGLIWPVRGGN